MRIRRLIPIVMFVVLGCAPWTSAAPITLTLAATPTTPLQGTFVDVTISVSVVDEDPNDGVLVDLAGYSFGLTYDPAVLELQQLSDVTDGGFLAGGVFFGPVTLSPPLLIGGALLFPAPGVTGSGVLAMVRLFALAAGPAMLGIVDPLFFTSDSFDPLAVDIVNNAGVRVLPAAVPEPASLALFGLGLLAFARRWR